MKQKQIQAILNELPLLLEKEIIDSTSFSKMKSYYMSLLSKSKKNILFPIISSIAGLLIGSGIILLLAHNWDEISRSTKTIIAFIPLLTGQLLSIYSYIKKKSLAWTEFSAIFLSLSVGSTIALISQIYNMPGDMEGFLFIWIILIFPVIYIMKSLGVLLHYLVMIIFWAAFAQYENGQSALYWIFFTAILPYFYLSLKNKISQNRKVVISWIVPINFLVGTGIAIEGVVPGLWILIYSLMVTMFYLIGTLYYKKEVSLFHNPFKIIGITGIISLSYIFTFKDVWVKIGWEYLQVSHSYNHTIAYFDYVLIILLFFISKYLFYKIRKTKSIDNTKEIITFSIFPIISVITYLVVSSMYMYDKIAFNESTFIPLIIFNLYLSINGALIIYQGVQSQLLYKINLGMGILLLIIISRFFDMDISFTTKGVIFILLGFIFLFVNLYLSKKLKKEIS